MANDATLSPTASPPPDYCETCRANTGTLRYCALGRCYCGHADCPAFTSWVELPALTNAHAAPARRSTTWDDREEATWIDQL